LCITGELYRRYPQYTEGHLARLRAYVVSRETCAKVAVELQLGRILKRYAPSGHDPNEIDHLAVNPNVLADLTEAVIGAIYLTFGFECVRGAVIQAFDEHILYAERSHVDSKTELQEVLAKSARTVTYLVVEQTGPAHDRRFSVEAVVDGEVLGHGEGPSKKRAEQMAAGEALAEVTARRGPDRPRRVRLLARRPRGAEAAPAPEDAFAPPEELHARWPDDGEDAAGPAREMMPAAPQPEGEGPGTAGLPGTGTEPAARPPARRRRRRSGSSGA
jgi:ribonuclease III